MKDVKSIIVAIRCFVYNHEPYLRKCLDGFVMQQTNFRYVAIVHDDCSTDSSATIIREYAEKYPDKIYPMYEERNLYSLNSPRLRQVVEDVQYATGAKYIAICEGDDCWTDPLKLQKQIDFLEEHPDYACCWHNYSICDTRTGEISIPVDKKTCEGNGCDVSIYDYFHGLCGGMPLTMVYRSDMYEREWCTKYHYFRDAHFIYLLLRKGKGYNMNFNGAIYNVHSDSEIHHRSRYNLTNLSFTIFSELYRDYPDDKVLRSYFQEVLIWNYRYSLKEGNLKTFYKQFLTLAKISLVFVVETFIKIIFVRIKLLKK